MYDVLKAWLDIGVDGFRLDVATGYFKDEEFRSNPFKLSLVPNLLQEHIYDRNRPEVHDVFRDFRRIADSYGGRVLIAETHGQSAALAASCYGKANDELHMAFNFEFLTRPWGAGSFRDSARGWYNSLPSGAWPNFTLGNHDQPRHIHRYRNGKATEARAKAAATLLLTLRGTPFLYYGEEIGMGCERLPREALRDPLGIKTWPLAWFGRDPERTPMQWDASEQAGFSAGTPWLPVNHDYAARNVIAQDSDPESLLAFYRKLLSLRKRTPALYSGGIEFLGDDRDVLAYRRTPLTEPAARPAQESRDIIVIINFENNSRTFTISEGASVLLGTRRRKGAVLNAGALRLDGNEVLILESNE